EQQRTADDGEGDGADLTRALGVSALGGVVPVGVHIAAFGEGAPDLVWPIGHRGIATVTAEHVAACDGFALHIGVVEGERTPQPDQRADQGESADHAEKCARAHHRSLCPSLSFTLPDNTRIASSNVPMLSATRMRKP